VLAALSELKALDLITAKQITDYMKANGIDQDKADPVSH